MHGDARHFANLLFRERIKRRTGNGQVIPLNDGELVDLHLQLLAGSANQNALLFQRTDQLQNAADIVDGGTADLLGALHDDLRTDPVPENSSCNSAPSS